MSDFGAPVAQDIDVNPLRSISQILGVQQQQQGLAGQAAQVQREQIAAQNAAVTQREQQALGQINPEQFTKDGVLDATAYGRAARAATPFSGLGQERAQKAYEVQSAQLGVQKAAQGLNQEQRTDASNALAAVVADPNMKYSDLVKAADTYKKQNPAAAPVMDHILQTLDPNESLDTTRHKVIAQNRSMLSAADISGTGGLATPASGLVDMGPNIQPIAGNRVTGEQTPVGLPFVKGLAPTDEPGYRRQVASASTTGTTEASSDQDAYNQIREAGNRSAQIKGLTQEVERLAGDVQTGTKSEGAAKLWSTLSQTLGLPVATATDRRILLGKYAAQLRNQASAGAPTDTARVEIEQAMPNPETMSPDAIKEAARYIRGSADVSAARLRNADKFQRAAGSINGLRSVDNDFMRNADPRVFQYKGLAPGAARQEFLKEHFTDKSGKPDVQAVSDFLGKTNALTHHGAFDGQ